MTDLVSGDTGRIPNVYILSSDQSKPSPGLGVATSSGNTPYWSSGDNYKQTQAGEVSYVDPTTGVRTVIADSGPAWDLYDGFNDLANNNLGPSSLLFFRNPSTGETAIWRVVNGALTQSQLLPPVVNDIYGWYFGGIFNNADGTISLQWANATTEEFGYWKLDPTTLQYIGNGTAAEIVSDQSGITYPAGSNQVEAEGRASFADVIAGIPVGIDGKKISPS